jgi:hypothetical protein
MISTVLALAAIPRAVFMLVGGALNFLFRENETAGSETNQVAGA